MSWLFLLWLFALMLKCEEGVLKGDGVGAGESERDGSLPELQHPAPHRRGGWEWLEKLRRPPARREIGISA
jgi:hypothetical protein